MTGSAESKARFCSAGVYRLAESKAKFCSGGVYRLVPSAIPGPTASVPGQSQGPPSASWEVSVFAGVASSSPQLSVRTLQGETAISPGSGDEGIRWTCRSSTKPRGLSVSARHSPCKNEGGDKDKWLAASSDEATFDSGDGMLLTENEHAPRLMSLGTGEDVLGAGEDVLFIDLVFLLGEIDKPKLSMDGKLSSGGAAAEPSPAHSGKPLELAAQVPMPRGCRIGSIAGAIPWYSWFRPWRSPQHPTPSKTPAMAPIAVTEPLVTY